MYRDDISTWVVREVFVARRGEVLEFAILGLLNEAPQHGYELRKRLNAVLGSWHAISYGSLYPTLRELVARDLIIEDEPGSAIGGSGKGAPGAPALAGRRARISYRLTADGKEHFQQLLTDAGPAAWEDDRFGVHFAFFARTDADVRLRILEGRRSRLEERLDTLRSGLTRTRERVDSYTLVLQQHGLDGVEREVRWLNELIATEQGRKPPILPDEPSDSDPASKAPGRSATGTRPQRPSVR
jgi:DNA-binding PadR family transcriptional regulator